MTKRVPLVTLILIGGNILAAFALFVYPDFGTSFGFRSNHPSFFSALSSLFFHANLFHLLGNMVFLAAVGAAVELSTGSLRFAAVYFISGLVGVGFHYAATRTHQDPAPLIGASGCIAGCAAYYSVRYTRLKVLVAPHLGLSVAGVTAIWAALQIIGAFVHFGDGLGGASYWSHVGGFIAGMLLSFAFRTPDLGHLQLRHEALAQMNLRGPDAMATAAKRHLEAHPNDAKILAELAEAQRQLGDGDEEAETLLRLLEVAPEADRADILRRLCQAGRVTKLNPLRRLQLADGCREAAPGVAKALLRSVVEGAKNEAQRPDAMLALAALERSESPEKAEQLLAELRETYPLHPAVDLARTRGWLV